MPQMSPLLWLFLFVYFTILFFVFIVNCYFMIVPVSSAASSSKSCTVNNLTWLW